MMKPGFTLIEILISLVILAIGCLGALAMQAYTLGRGSQIHHLTIAAALAESEVERLLSLKSGELSNATYVPPQLLIDRYGNTCAANDTSCYTRSVALRHRHPTRWSTTISVCVAIPNETICDNYNPNNHPTNQGSGKHLIYDSFITYVNFGLGD